MTLMSGTIIAQIVALAIIPILTRLYLSSEFGIYSLFFSITSILGLVSSLKYDQAIMLPKSENEARVLVFLSILFTFGVSIIVGIGLILFQGSFIKYFEDLSYFIWFIPLSVLLIGLIQIFNSYSSRSQLYKEMSMVRIANSVTVLNFQSLSKYLFKFDGLVFGKILGDIVSLGIFLFLFIDRQILNFKTPSWNQLYDVSKKYVNFLKYQSPTKLLNAISQNIPVLLFASLYSVEIAGFYALTLRVLQAPITLIGGSTKQVYYQKASKIYAAGDNILELYLKTTLGLLKLFIIPLIIVLFFGEYLFDFIFGNEWTLSGKMAQVLIVWFLFLFINSPSVMTYSILNLQKVQMRLEMTSFFFRFSSIYAGFYFFDSYSISIILFVISSVIINIFMISIIYLKLKKR